MDISIQTCAPVLVSVYLIPIFRYFKISHDIESPCPIYGCSAFRIPLILGGSAMLLG